MCSACGIIGGGPEWLDRVDNPDGVPHRGGLTRAAERQRRIALGNLLLRQPGLGLRDLGRQMAIASPTGRTVMVDDLRHVWMEADRMAGGGIDPLDAAVLDRLEGAGRG